MDAAERFSAYLSEHFAEYEFRITGSTPFDSDEFIVLPIMGSETSPGDPDGGFVMHETPDPSILEEIAQVCRSFDIGKSRLS